MSTFQELYDEVFHILRTKLPPFLTYHTPEHTQRVLDMAVFISEKENVTGHRLELIKIAALFHDIGFIDNADHHEEKSCRILRDMVARYNFPEEDLEKICGMIMATKIPQQPKTILEDIVADADLEYLGTDSFYPISQNLFREFRHYNPKLDIHRFNEIQVKFIKNHKYHTEFCKQNREAKKQEHLEKLVQELQLG